MLKKIWVAGADGFIASQLTETLVRAGSDVKAFVLYNSFISLGWLDQSKPYERCPRTLLSITESLAQRLMNLPCSAGLV
ncbi:hypothetical protein OAC78_08850 [Litorivicinus sp.]|nr:hypothetical protein [Litorivicinus sp.]